MHVVFADTGHEHPATLEYVDYLGSALSLPIRWVRADFTAQIARKRDFVANKWPGALMKGRPEKTGYWLLTDPDFAAANDNLPEPSQAPHNPIEPARYGPWEWVPTIPGIDPMTEDQAGLVVERALSALRPTGNPFLDMCLWKGRFPSAKARFCTGHLKVEPINEHVVNPLLSAGHSVLSWQGVRAEESAARARLAERGLAHTAKNGAELWDYRPILKWSIDDVFAIARHHGIKPNPLYTMGMGRVGCMPCIHARKNELLEISKRFPEEVARVAEWEDLVAMAAKRGSSTFFAACDLGCRHNDKRAQEAGNIHRFVDWAKTSRGGKQFDFLRADNENLTTCSSIYGLCE